MLFPYFVYIALLVLGNIFAFVKATGTSGVPRWCPDFDQNLP